MVTVVCPGSFDPPTVGHVDVITRAAELFDDVVVAVGVNVSKSRLFSAEERIELLTEVFADNPRVRVEGFSGLVTSYCTQIGATAIVKGIRGSGDVDYENQMAAMNARLSGVDTVYLPSRPEHSFVSSSLVKEVAGFGGDVTPFLPPTVRDRLLARLADRT
ncbi:MAG: pantetheine-phosphate adenylyltransferase [Nocardioides sp.]